MFIVLGMMACGKNRDLEEGDRNTYTIKGKIFKGISDEPFANETLYIEMDVNGISESSSNILAESTTDADGYFSLTYKQVKRTNDATVALLAPGAGTPTNLIKSLPINENIDSDFASIPHVRILLIVHQTNSITDSLLMVPIGLADAERRLNKSLNEYEDGKIVLLPLNKGSTTETFLKCYTISTFLESGLVNWGFNYFLGEEDYLMAVHADSVNDPSYILKQKWVPLNGFPVIDTVYLEI